MIMPSVHFVKSSLSPFEIPHRRLHDKTEGMMVVVALVGRRTPRRNPLPDQASERGRTGRGGVHTKTWRSGSQTFLRLPVSSILFQSLLSFFHSLSALLTDDVLSRTLCIVITPRKARAALATPSKPTAQGMTAEAGPTANMAAVASLML